MRKGSVVAAVRAIAEPLAESLGYVIWDIEYVKEGADMYLRITIDKEDGVDIEDCERMHRAIDPLLDEADPIEEAYHLEISSPGIERELKNAFHIEACEGWQVEARLYAPIDGAKSFLGELLPMTEDGRVAIQCTDGVTRTFSEKELASLRTHYDFSSDNG